MIRWQVEGLPDAGIVECADDDRADFQPDCLQINVLRGVSNFDVRVAVRALTVFLRTALINPRDYQHGWRTTHPGLVEGSLGQWSAQVSTRYLSQPMFSGHVPVHTSRQRINAAGDEVKLERVERARGRCRTAAISRRHTLRRPEELRHIGKRQ